MAAHCPRLLLVAVFSLLTTAFSLAHTNPLPAHWRDPLLPSQWHLYNPKQRDAPDGPHDVNVVPVWREGVTGAGVTVCIIDDGVEFDHPDLVHAIRPELSYDFNLNRPLPLPQGPGDQHGTRCAGQIAARAGNGVCGVGVAPDASISAIRLLGGDITAEREAAAVTFRNDANDIYSCSWGPSDDGRTVEGPDVRVLRAFVSGLTHGRQRRGSVFVFAAGNGRAALDNCNYDGYANGPFSITIGAIDVSDTMPYYMEECAAMLAVTYSSGGGTGQKITTTDRGGGCTDRHGGTSAAAPLAAGLLALALSVRPELTWRDMQHLLVETAVPFRLDDPSWVATAAGRRFSPRFGFGKMDAERLVARARVWSLVNLPVVKALPWKTVREPIPSRPHEGIVSHIHLDYALHWHYFGLHDLTRLEHVTVSVNVMHGRRGDLVFVLRSPGGTVIPLTSPRPLDDDARDGLMGWTLSTVAFWGETEILGTWSLQIINTPAAGSVAHAGQFLAWRLSLWGEAVSNATRAAHPDRFAMDFVNNYYPPTPDYFVDVDGIWTGKYAHMYAPTEMRYRAKDTRSMTGVSSHSHPHAHLIRVALIFTGIVLATLAGYRLIAARK